MLPEGLPPADKDRLGTYRFIAYYPATRLPFYAELAETAESLARTGQFVGGSPVCR